MRTNLPYPRAIQLVRDAYKALALGKAENPDRAILRVPGGASMFFMPGYVHGRKYVVMKAARMNPENSRQSLPTIVSTVYVYDFQTGVQAAEVEAELLTMIRTAASTAVATDFLARRDVKILGIFGSGREALAHIAALLEVRDFERVLVYSRNLERREMFAKEMTDRHGIPVKAAGSAEEAARKSDVIVSATTSQTPVFEGTIVMKGSTVNAIGNAVPEGREIDTKLVERSSLVVDSHSQALTTYGDIIKPIKENAIQASEILELGDLLIGKAKLPSQRDVTLFKSGGLAVLDAIVVEHILDSMPHGNR
ncbi:MAG TPA: NAD(P)-binding domain-containing protein [Candidatus Bathyarchaeia archaeon]|nr:NAD(P)-binding domain-containing protein [Candidatus Bathyarchaeia archaeon]